MQGFTWKRCDHWSSISYCCGRGQRVSRGPNPLSQAQLGGIRNGSCPEADPFKACTDVPIPPPRNHPSARHTGKKTSPWTLSWPHNQNKALRWHLLSQEHPPSLWIGISSALQFIFLSPSWSLCPPGLLPRLSCPFSGHGCEWPESVFPNYPLVAACFLKESRSSGCGKDTERGILNNTS